MESNLRPLTLGEILDRTAQLYRTNFLVFAGIFAIYAGVVMVLNLSHIGVLAWLSTAHPATWVTVTIGVAAVLKALLIFVFAGAAIAAINRAVAWVHLGQPATIRGAYASTLPQLGRYLWLMTIVAFFVWLPLVFLVPVIGIGIAMVPGVSLAHPNPTTPQGVGAFLVLGLVVLLLMIPWIVYATWMTLRYALAVPACVVEDLKARKAIRRSIELTKGSRGRIFLLLLLVFVLEIALVLVSQLFLVVVAVKHPGQPLSLVAQAISQIIAFFTNTFLGPIYATGVALFYYDQRIRKEGYDIEWMMQAAGLTAPAAAQPVAAEGEVSSAGSPEEPPEAVSVHE
jgi:uncharacterized membrane protein